MNTNTYQGSAKIYQFPVRGRNGGGARRDGSYSGVEPKAQHIIENAAGACWYHEAAIVQAAGALEP